MREGEPTMLQAPSCDGRPVMVVCRWCPGSQQTQEAFEALGFVISHGICPACRAREFPKR